MELKGIVSPEFLRLPLVFAKKRKLNTFLCVVRNSSSHQFRETFPMSYHRWKPIEVHCNDSAHSILQPSVCTSDSTTLPELAFGRFTITTETCGIQKRRFGRFVARGAVLDEEYWVWYDTLSSFQVKDDKNVKRTVLNSVVGTPDLKDPPILQGETYPG
ncbi:hypothetical protein IFM89_031345 [Coptis chinensis]|uniref:Uncharacterized protein n=1 Tax=Coptis chinensis TaxID=261450 RepID=A0A835J328_9MAGN|nr:hypothetical protein IFM89_031345 [Coptis chinensis]